MVTVVRMLIRQFQLAGWDSNAVLSAKRPARKIGHGRTHYMSLEKKCLYVRQGGKKLHAEPRRKNTKLMRPIRGCTWLKSEMCYHPWLNRMIIAETRGTEVTLIPRSK